MPGILLLYGLLSLVFRALFNHRVSRYFRKYSFYGILLLIVYEGSVEQFTFYFLEECKLFFSGTFSHKLANLFIVYFFFLTLFFSVGGLIWFKFHYKSLVKYFTEEYKSITLYLLTLETLEKSVFPFLFGAAHSLLLHNLPVQTIVLGCIEVCYLIGKVAWLKALGVLFKWKVGLLGTTSMLRMILIVTLYLYQANDAPAIINRVHHIVVWLYLICWIL